jgi:hypothetical protein
VFWIDSLHAQWYASPRLANAGVPSAQADRIVGLARERLPPTKSR